MSRLPGLVKHPSNHWGGDSDVDSDFVAGPSRKKARLSGKRFAVVDAKDVDESKAPLSAKNTDKSTLWAVRAFMSWLQEYNERDGNDEKCPLDVMCLGDDALLCRWLCLFVTEARQSNGKSYTPRSISQLLTGLQRYINSRRDPHEARLRLTDPSSAAYRELHNVLQRLYRELHKSGIGASRRQAAVITVDEERILWEKGVLSTQSTQSLLNTVFYLTGLHFVLRGGQEHRELKLSQFKFKTLPNPDKAGEQIEVVEYTEFSSKNRPGGTKQLNLTNKVVVRYARPDQESRCLVSILKLYVSKLPPCAKEKDIFYWKALEGIPPGDVLWYKRSPLGHNTLDRMLKEIMLSGGLDDEKKTNHSLRATAISRMYDQKVQEKIIMEQSGHLSRDGVRVYERITNQQQKEVSDILSDVTFSSTVNASVDKPIPEICVPEFQPSSSVTKELIGLPRVPASATSGFHHFPESVSQPFTIQNVHGCTFNFSFQK